MVYVSSWLVSVPNKPSRFCGRKATCLLTLPWLAVYHNNNDHNTYNLYRLRAFARLALQEVRTLRAVLCALLVQIKLPAVSLLALYFA